MGVFSFSRYDDHFYERSYAGRLKKKIELMQGDYSVFESYYTPPFTSVLLLRSCKVKRDDCASKLPNPYTEKSASMLNTFKLKTSEQILQQRFFYR